jgi:hypothetical protein
VPVPIQRPTGAKPWGLLGYLKDFISPPGYVSRGPLGSRPAAAATLDRAPTDAELRAEGYRPLSGEFSLAGRAQPNAIVTGLTPAGEVDRTKSDLYRQYAPKPFPATPEGQLDRYFKTPEMDQYFGTASRGKGAPSDVAGMEELAGQLTAPKDTSLASYYRAQSAAGRAQMPEIQKGLGYAEGSDLAKWAAANPMLAQRLYAKKQAAESPQAPAAPGYEAGVQPLTETESFSMAANGVPAPWNTQGEKVSSEFSGVVPFQAAKTTGEGMPAFQTTGEKAAEFLKRPNISALF